MNEAQVRQYVVKQLQHVDAFSVENSARVGTPDVNTTLGWIELKYLPAWPARWDTPVKIPCFSPQQKVWLRRRTALGGAAFLLIRIGDDWLLFDGRTAADKVGALTYTEMFHNCIWKTHKSLDGRALSKVMREWGQSN